MPPPPAEYKYLAAVDRLDIFLLPTVFLFLCEVTENIAPANLRAIDGGYVELGCVAQELRSASSSLLI
jgi:hypothetical protein